MASPAEEAGRRAATESASAGTPLRTAQDSGYRDSVSDYNRGVQSQQQQDSQSRGK